MTLILKTIPVGWRHILPLAQLRLHQDAEGNLTLSGGLRADQVPQVGHVPAKK